MVLIDQAVQEGRAAAEWVVAQVVHEVRHHHPSCQWDQLHAPPLLLCSVKMWREIVAVSISATIRTATAHRVPYLPMPPFKVPIAIFDRYSGLQNYWHS